MPRFGFSFQSHYIPPSIPVINHPLAHYVAHEPPTNEQPAASNSEVAEFSDPLGVHFNFDRELATTNDEAKATPNGTEVVNGGPLVNTLADEKKAREDDLDPEFAGFRPWREYRELIETTFHSAESLKFETSFLHPTAHDRKRSLNNEVGGQKLHELSEEEYCRAFRDLRKVLDGFWAEEKRIECIKLCAETASFLSQPHASRFYPRKFVLVTDLLDHFGRLVFDRLLKKANEERTADVLEKTRIRARNWLGKISQIRDPIARIYIGMALMSTMKFVDEAAIGENVMRLCFLCCSVHHPLTSSYARLYICRQTHSQQPAALLWPALEYVIQCVAFKAVTYEDLLPLWEYCRLPDKRPFMLKAMLRALPPLYLAEHALHACKLIAGSEDFSAEELTEFGRSLLKANVSESNRRPLLRSMWKCTMSVQQAGSFAAAAAVWSEFAARYFTMNEVDVIFESIIKRMSKDRVRCQCTEEVLASIVKKTAKSIRDVADLLNLDVFPQFLQLIADRKQTKEVARVILELLIVSRPVGSVKEAKLGYQILEMCKVLHDFVTIYTDEKEVNQIAELIAASLNRVQLREYVIERILELALFVVKSARFSSARAAFIQACIANAYISTPSLSDPVLRIQLHLKAAEVALASMTFLQVDSFVLACLDEFAAFPPDRAAKFEALGAQFLAHFFSRSPSMTVAVYLEYFQSFFRSVDEYSWPSSSARSSLLFAAVRFLYALRRPTVELQNFAQFRLDFDAEGLAEKIDELLEAVFSRISGLIAAESDQKPLISVQLLENLANSAGRVDRIARSTAKLAYKNFADAE
ncbi:hypothetical protein M3Y99_00195700 [Aphelenchoides fujianensis]|nr:hypothetical protein M3Y99_00195700 [Aphelenchoides fujianensis]